LCCIHLYCSSSFVVLLLIRLVTEFI
jgi:hypothetical protein